MWIYHPASSIIMLENSKNDLKILQIFRDDTRTYKNIKSEYLEVRVYAYVNWWSVTWSMLV